MTIERVIKKREIINGKWVGTEELLDDDGPNAVPHKKIVIESPDASKRVVLSLDDDGVLKITDEDGNEHRMLQTGLNSQSGTVTFNGTKSMRVDFPVPFTNHPGVTVSLGDSNNNPVYRVWVGKTGFTVRFKLAFIGEVQWVAVEA